MRSRICQTVLLISMCSMTAGLYAQGGPPERGQREGREGREGRPGQGFGGGPGMQGPGMRGPEMRGPGNPMQMVPILAALDANGDGEISAEEIANAVAVLKTLDKNQDGKLTTDEVMPPFRGEMRGPGRPAGFGGPDMQEPSPEMLNRMMQFDRNGDGKLGKEEFPERMQPMFARADTDKDGFVTRDELQKVMKDEPGDRGPRGPQRGDGRGRDGAGRPGNPGREGNQGR